MNRKKSAHSRRVDAPFCVRDYCENIACGHTYLGFSPVLCSDCNATQLRVLRRMEDMADNDNGVDLDTENLESASSSVSRASSIDNNDDVPTRQTQKELQRHHGKEVDTTEYTKADMFSPWDDLPILPSEAKITLSSLPAQKKKATFYCHGLISCLQHVSTYGAKCESCANVACFADDEKMVDSTSSLVAIPRAFSGESSSSDSTLPPHGFDAVNRQNVSQNTRLGCFRYTMGISDLRGQYKFLQFDGINMPQPLSGSHIVYGGVCKKTGNVGFVAPAHFTSEEGTNFTVVAFVHTVLGQKRREAVRLRGDKIDLINISSLNASDLSEYKGEPLQERDIVKYVKEALLLLPGVSATAVAVGSSSLIDLTGSSGSKKRSRTERQMFDPAPALDNNKTPVSRQKPLRQGPPSRGSQASGGARQSRSRQKQAPSATERAQAQADLAEAATDYDGYDPPALPYEPPGMFSFAPPQALHPVAPSAHPVAPSAFAWAYGPNPYAVAPSAPHQPYTEADHLRNQAQIEKLRLLSGWT